MANTKYIAVNCSLETKNKIDEYKKKHNLAQYEVLDYMVKLLEESDRNGSVSAGEAKLIEESEKQTLFMRLFSEKLYALAARIFITQVMKGKQYDQNEVLTTAKEQASSVVNEILSELEKVKPSFDFVAVPAHADSAEKPEQEDLFTLEADKEQPKPKKKKNSGTMDRETRALFGFDVEHDDEDDDEEDEDDEEEEEEDDSDDPVLLDPRLDYNKLPKDEPETEEKPIKEAKKEDTVVPFTEDGKKSSFNTTPIVEEESEGDDE